MWIPSGWLFLLLCPACFSLSCRPSLQTIQLGKPSPILEGTACRFPCSHSTPMTAPTTPYSNGLFAHLSHPLSCQLCKLLEGEDYILITFIIPAPSTEPGTADTPRLFVEWINQWTNKCSATSPVWVRQEISGILSLLGWREPYSVTMAMPSPDEAGYLIFQQNRKKHDEIWHQSSSFWKKPQTLRA